MDQPPEKKTGLLELLKNLWLPVTGFVGAVTLLYNFYQSWRGDQAVVTYISGGIGLLILMIALAWVGFGTRRVTRKILLLDDKSATEKLRIYNPIYQRAAQIALVFVFFAGLIGIGVIFQRRQALQNKLVVLIATFEGPEEVYGLRNEIIENLNIDFPNDGEVEIIKIGEIITPDQGSSYARVLGERYLADVVFWGWYRPTQNPNITIHVENLNPDQLLPLQISDILHPNVTLAELESFSFQQQSGKETSALISFLAGYLQYKSKNYAQALARFDDAIVKIPGDVLLLKNQAEIYFYRGNIHLTLKQDEQAISDYSKAIQINPQEPIVYYNRGNVYNNLQQYDQAIADFSKVVEIDPQHTLAYNNRGVVYGIQQQYEQAKADFFKAIQINPQDAGAYNNLGNIYFIQKEYDKAIANFSEAIQIDPQSADAYSNRSTVYDNLQQHDQAIADCSTAIQLNPQDAKIYYNCGLVYAHQKLYEKAITNYSKAIQINTQYAKAYNNRGLAYVDQKQYDEAISDFSKAIHINPNDDIAYKNRGFAYAHQKKYNQVIADFSKVIEINPKDAITYYNRGLTYQALGKTVEAEADFAKYKELTGQDAP